MLFSHVKISSFRAKAHLVFHWWLYNNEATNCFSVITLMIIRENKIIDRFPTPKHQNIWLPF